MITDCDIARLRLLNQQLNAGPSRTPYEVVHTLGAMQAQDYEAALWAIGLRLPGSTRLQIEQAIAERHIVRSWPMRGTLHFVDAGDIHWMLELLAPRVIGNTARRDKQLGLDQTVYENCARLLQHALHGGKQLSRNAIYQLLEEGGISTEGQRGYHILWHLGQLGVLCFGTQEDKQPSFVLLDEWVPDTERFNRDKALAELALRYFIGHGPATVTDLTAWSKLTLTDARRGLEMVCDRLQSIRQNDSEYWMPKKITDNGNSPHTLLLPAFDEYLLGYKDRSAVLSSRYANRVAPGGNGVFRPLMVLHGKVVGTWKRTAKKNSVSFTWEPFDKLKKADLAAFDIEAERYAAFLGLPLC